MSALDLVRVDWYDAEGYDNWNLHRDILEWAEAIPPLITTYGLLVFQSEFHVVVLQTYSETQLRGALKIPRGCVKTIDTLESTTLTV